MTYNVFKILFLLFTIFSLFSFPAQSQQTAEEIFQQAEKYKDASEWDKAEELYLSAANKGHIDAQSYLGELYSWGWGGKKDLKKAFNWYMKAALQNDLYSQHSIGIAYEVGLGIGQDDDDAMFWFMKAAKNGYADSAARIATIYEEQFTIFSRNEKEINTLKWYLIAISGDPFDEWNIKNKIKELRENLSAKQIKTAEQEAAKWIEQNWPTE